MPAIPCSCAPIGLEQELEALIAPHPINRLGGGGRAAGRRMDADAELGDAEATLSILAKLAAPVVWVVLDSYRLGHRWERRVRDAGHRILVIDDHRDRRHHADMLVGDAEAPFDPALNELAGTARALAGRRYAIVDPGGPAPPGIGDEAAGATHLLVSYGGADPTEETVKALEAVQAVRNAPGGRSRIGRVVIVAGPANPRFRDIARAVEGIEDATLHRMVPSLVPLIGRSDLVLTSGGNSMVEALALGKPCLVTVTADNQVLGAAEFDRDGVIRSLGHHAGIDAAVLSTALGEVIAGLDAFAARIASRPPVDRLGARRVAAEMRVASAPAVPGRD